MDREELCSGLNTVNQSAAFLIALVLSVLLSLSSLLLQRQAICDALDGQEPTLSSLYPMRHIASSINVGTLGFFLCLAARSMKRAAPEDPVARRSARDNFVAAILVFLAAAIRFDDIQILRGEGRL